MFYFTREGEESSAFNFDGGSFVYLKLRDFDVGFVLHLQSFFRFLMSSVELGFCPSWSGNLFKWGSCLELVWLLQSKSRVTDDRS